MVEPTSNEPNDDITAESVPHLTDQEKQVKTIELQKSLDELEEGVANQKSFIHKIAIGGQREFFTEWAFELEKLHYLGEFDKPINDISIHIRARLGKMDLPLEIKENLYNNLDRNLDSKYKHTKLTNPQNEDNNTSEIPDSDFMRNSLIVFENVLLKMAHNVNDLHSHLKNPDIHQDFLDVLEWREISIFCDATNNLLLPKNQYGVLRQIEGEQNIRETATILQKAIQVTLKAFNSYRKMAHKFGISPRQNQRIRKRLPDWPDKEPEKIIKNVYSSYQCIKCGFCPTTGRTNDDVKMLNDKYWLKIKYGGKQIPIPDIYKKKGLQPIEIAEKLWGHTLKLEVPDKKKMMEIKVQ